MRLRSVTSSFQRLLAALMVSATALVSCSEPPPPPPPPPVEAPPPPFEHVVRYSGETLGLIAKWYTGKSQNWQQLKQANPNLKPNRISIGDVVLIPPDLVTKREPLPKTVVTKWVRGAGSSDASKEGESTGDTMSGSSAGAGTDMTTPDKSADTAGEASAGEDTGAGTAGTKAAAGSNTNAVDELDQLEKELESALAERGQPKNSGAANGGGAAGQKADPAKDAAAKNSGAKSAGSADETEREKLLDELLAE